MKVKKFLVSVLLLLTVLSSAVFAVNYPVERFKLKNGMTILLQKIPESPVVSLAVIYRVGSRNERIGITGITHVLEHMLHKNTKKYPKGRMAAVLNRVGADFNAFTSNDVSGFYETLAPEYLELALHIEADRMKNAELTAEDLNMEKKIILAEAAAYESKPSYQLWKQVRASSFIHHPYMWPAQGYNEDIQNLTLNQVKWYYKTNYTPKNAVMAVVGNFNTAKTKTLIKKFFTDARNSPGYSNLEFVQAPPVAEKEVKIYEQGNLPLLHISYRSPSVKDDDLYAMAVIDSILTGGKTARLNQALTKNGKCRNVNAWLDTNQDPGLYYLRFTLRPGVDYSEVEETVTAEIEKLKNEPISDEELNKAKTRLKAQFIKTRDSITNQAQHLAWYEAISSYKYLSDYPGRIDSVSADDIIKVANKCFTPHKRVTGKVFPRGTNIIEEKEEADLPEEEPTSYDSSATPLMGCSTFSIASLQKEPLLLAAKPKAKKTAKSKKKPAPKPQPKPKPKPYSPPIPEARPYDLKFTRHKLSNGVVLLIHENHINPSVTIKGLVKAGSMYEKPEKAGLSKLTAYMLQQGNKNLTQAELNNKLDTMGADLTINTGLQNTNFEIWAPSDKLETVVPILGSVVTNPGFSDEELGKLKKLMNSHLNILNKRLSVVSEKDFYEEVFPGNHPFHHFRWGTDETIANINLDDIVKFYQVHYRPEAMLIAVTGDIEPGKVIESFEQAFGSWQAKGPSPQLMMPTVELAETTRREINRLPGKQVEIIMGHKGISRTHPDYYKFFLMNYMLGGAPVVNRLSQDLKNKGLAYKIGSKLNTSISDGPWSVTLTTDRVGAERAINGVERQMKYMQGKAPSAKELKDARLSLIGSLPVQLQTNKNVASMLLNIEYYKLGDNYLKNLAKVYQQITPEDIKATAEKYLHPDRMYIIMSGQVEK
ncbi:MAG: M16 family metallopeptidase [Vulcanimicrobiota bacterium]